jgi:hypothetical protein
VTSGPAGRTAPDTASIAARISQVICALVIGAVSVLLLVTLHRVQLSVLGLSLPIGLVIGAVFQFACSTFLWASTGARLPVVVLGCVWGLMVMPFAGRGAGGGVLMPAIIGEQTQYSGWIVQGIGVAVPFVFLGVQLLVARRSARARS